MNFKSLFFFISVSNQETHNVFHTHVERSTVYWNQLGQRKNMENIVHNGNINVKKSQQIKKVAYRILATCHCRKNV